MRKLETNLAEEMRSLRKGISLILRRQELMLEVILGVEQPTAGDVKAIKEFEMQKKKGKLKLIPLSKIT